MSYNAVICGACASIASLFGKLSGLPMLEDLFLLRVVCFLFMIGFNVVMWTFFVKALNSAQSSLTPTVISAATNYIISAINGYYFFGEVTSILWWSGMALILTGLCLLLNDERDSSTNEKSK